MVTIDGSLTVKQGESQPGQLRPTMIGFWTSGAAAGAMVLGSLPSEAEKATRIVTPTVGWVWMSMVTIDGSLTVKQGESQSGQLRPTMIGFWTSGAAAGAMVLGSLPSEAEKATRIVTRRLA